MANRDLTNFRTVINQVAENPSNLLGAAAEMGIKVIEDSQKAKITEAVSAASLDLEAMNFEYRNKMSGDPMGALEKMKSDRKRIFDQYGQGISPFFKKTWQQEVRTLEMRDDASNQQWALKQSQVNTVNSVNNAIKNNLKAASSAGMEFGQSDDATLDSMLKFGQSASSLMTFASESLGQERAVGLLSGYSNDYMKSFVSGVADTNPIKALRILDEKGVQEAFNDPKEFMAMRKAVETKALNIDKRNSEMEILNIMRDENNLLAKSLEQPMSYVDLMTEMDRGNYSEDAKKFFLKANGFSSETKKLTPSEQMLGKAQLYQDLFDLTSGTESGVIAGAKRALTGEEKKTITPKQVNEFQSKIYRAMNNGTLSENEGAGMLSQIVTPFVEQKSADLEKFSDNAWFDPDLGLSGLNDIFDKEMAIPVPEPKNKDNPSQTDKAAMDIAVNQNAQNKVRLYDYYMENVAEIAKQYNVSIGQIPNLNRAQRRKIFSEAQSAAKKAYLVDRFPDLATVNDLPNQVFSDGKLIQGMAGNRDIKPDASVKQDFVIQLGDDGYLYRTYTDGTIEKAGLAPEGMKY